MNTIIEIVSAEPYKLILKFGTGETRQVDLSEKLNEWGNDPQSRFSELKDPANFKKVKVESEFGSVVWENGIDLCPDVLYDLSLETKSKIVA